MNTVAQPAVKAIPEGMHSLTPHLICAGAADAIAFYVKAFNAVELVDGLPSSPLVLDGLRPGFRWDYEA